MKFHDNAVMKASMRQYDGQGMGIPCARCKTWLDTIPKEGESWYAIPRIPIKKGGKKADNCVIVCPKCYFEIGQDGTKTIPYSELPYFKGKP